MAARPPVPQPFQVDNIADVWTMLTALGTVGAAAGTVAAFWVAAVSYRRQVNNEGAAQASKVTIYESDRGVIAENLDDLPIYSAVLVVQSHYSHEPYTKTQARLTKNDNLAIVTRPLGKDRAWVMFTDANGRRWIRYLNGTLKPEKNKS